MTERNDLNSPVVDDEILLDSLDTDLHATEKRTDNRLLVLIGLLASLMYLYDRSSLKQPWIPVALALCILGSIVYTLVSVVHAKQRVAASYGLVCKSCGCKPKTLSIITTAIPRRCRKCGAPLEPAIP